VGVLMMVKVASGAWGAETTAAGVNWIKTGAPLAAPPAAPAAGRATLPSAGAAAGVADDSQPGSIAGNPVQPAVVRTATTSRSPGNRDQNVERFIGGMDSFQT
jgi:hypothetical protein